VRHPRRWRTRSDMLRWQRHNSHKELGHHDLRTQNLNCGGRCAIKPLISATANHQPGSLHYLSRFARNSSTASYLYVHLIRPQRNPWKTTHLIGVAARIDTGLSKQVGACLGALILRDTSDAECGACTMPPAAKMVRRRVRSSVIVRRGLECMVSSITNS
jgi:hypothetical protein